MTTLIGDAFFYWGWHMSHWKVLDTTVGSKKKHMPSAVLDFFFRTPSYLLQLNLNEHRILWYYYVYIPWHEQAWQGLHCNGSVKWSKFSPALHVLSWERSALTIMTHSWHNAVSIYTFPGTISMNCRVGLYFAEKKSLFLTLYTYSFHVITRKTGFHPPPFPSPSPNQKK